MRAGLYDCWKDEEASEPMHSCTILTTDASTRFQTLHDRMPVILPTEVACMEWLGCSWDDLSSNNWSRYLEICKPYTGQDLVWHPVTTKVSGYFSRALLWAGWHLIADTCARI